MIKNLGHLVPERPSDHALKQAVMSGGRFVKAASGNPSVRQIKVAPLTTLEQHYTHDALAALIDVLTAGS